MDTSTYFSLNPWWEGKDFASGIPRRDYLNNLWPRFDRPQIEIVVGSRRIGKTTFLKQIIKKLLEKGVETKKILYLTCDHPSAIGVKLSEHLNNFRRLFDHQKDAFLYLFLDEVQESPNWELELKALYDNEKLKIVGSGSTSALIKTHGGKLTGRQIHTILYPLTFLEFLNFREKTPNFSEGYLWQSQAEEYLQVGGYPENVLNPSSDYLGSLLDDIFLRDLIRLYPIKNQQVLKDLFKLLAASVGTPVSFNKLSHVLGISLETVKIYLEYLENAFLTARLEKWSFSHTQRVYSPKKIYLWDTGLKTLLTGAADLGFKAENVVFSHLIRKNPSLGYFSQDQKEVDFIAGDLKSPKPIEVKYQDELALEDKKLSGVKSFLKHNPNAKSAQVITKNLERIMNFQGIPIEFIPLWRFLLETKS